MTIKVKLWFIRESAAARLYSKLPPSRSPEDKDKVWLPISQIEHVTKFPTAEKEEWPIHVVTIPEWFAYKKGLL